MLMVSTQKLCIKRWHRMCNGNLIYETFLNRFYIFCFERTFSFKILKRNYNILNVCFKDFFRALSKNFMSMQAMSAETYFLQLTNFYVVLDSSI